MVSSVGFTDPQNNLLVHGMLELSLTQAPEVIAVGQVAPILISVTLDSNGRIHSP